MSHQSVDQTAAHAGPDAFRRPACLVAGCPCKDARIVSHRRAAFFASLSRSRGQTADRVVASDAEWRLPGAADPEATISAAP